MQEAQRSTKLPSFCRRISIAAILLAFLMVLAAPALKCWGPSEALTALGAEAALVGYILWYRLRDSGTSWSQFLVTGGKTGPNAPPSALLVAGAVFWGPGLYVLLTAAEPLDPQPGQMRFAEQLWFGTTFLLTGLGVSGVGLYGRLARRALLADIARLSNQVRSHPREAESYFQRGTLLLEQGDLEEAADDFAEVVRLRPECLDAYLQRARAYFDLGEYEKAIADYSVVIKLDPRRAEAYLERASANENLDRAEQADADFAKAKELGME